MVDWITPRTEAWNQYGNRELGLLESAQHLLLLCSLFILISAYPASRHNLHRVGFVAGILLIAFVFLEEIDYGSHYWDWLTDAKYFAGDVGFHNNSGLSSEMKKISDVLMLIWFLLLPMFAPYSKSVWIRFLAAPRLIIVTLIVGVVLSKIAHTLDHNGYAIRDSLSRNISEFREFFTYYIWFLYCRIMTKRPWPLSDQTASNQSVSDT